MAPGSLSTKDAHSTDGDVARPLWTERPGEGSGLGQLLRH